MTAAGEVMPAICFEGVHFSYDGRPVVEGADFDVFPGESVCVVGPNGGGKTTLLKLMLGLLRPENGRIRVFGDAPERARGRIGYVPQHLAFDPLFPVNALDVVAMGRIERGTLGFRRRADREAAHAALRQVGLADKAEAAFATLSGGQRQAVLIARALAAETRILLLDEPDAHIDLKGRERLLEILEGLPNTLTQVIVSHDLSFVTTAVPKVICVHGHVHLHPTSELTPPRLREIFGRDLLVVRHEREHPDSHGVHAHGASYEESDRE